MRRGFWSSSRSSTSPRWSRGFSPPRPRSTGRATGCRSSSSTTAARRARPSARPRWRGSRRPGVDVVHVRRGTREGFKPGALAYGMTLNDAPYVAILDADFRAPPDWLAALVAGSRPIRGRPSPRAATPSTPEEPRSAGSRRWRRTGTTSSNRACAPPAACRSSSTVPAACGAAARSRPSAAGGRASSRRTSTSRSRPSSPAFAGSTSRTPRRSVRCPRRKARSGPSRTAGRARSWRRRARWCRPSSAHPGRSKPRR